MAFAYDPNPKMPVECFVSAGKLVSILPPAIAPIINPFS
jgi:hypothetical protein